MPRICMLGGSGFVGRVITAQLAARQWQVRILSRHPERHRDLLVAPTVNVVAGDVHNPVFLRRQFQDVDTVINLAGILNERGHRGREFERVHARLPAAVAQACGQAGVRRLLHMSALHAAHDGPSHYLRTKAAGEDAAHAAVAEGLHVTSFRPSVIFGPRDSFINRFARLLRLSPFVFPLACPDSRFQPVYVEDVARAYVEAIDNPKTHGQRYDLCGPKVYTLRELIAYIAGMIGVRRKIIGLNDGLSLLQAAVLEFAPGKPFSLDNYRSLQVDSVCIRGFPAIFGITPAALEDIVPTYLHQSPRSRTYSLLRRHTGR